MWLRGFFCLLKVAKWCKTSLFFVAANFSQSRAGCSRSHQNLCKHGRLTFPLTDGPLGIAVELPVSLHVFFLVFTRCLQEGFRVCSVYACDARISLMANMHAGIYNRTHTFARVCAYLCRFGAEISRQYLLSNVCSLEETQKPSGSNGAAESLSDGRRSKPSASLERPCLVIFLVVSRV